MALAGRRMVAAIFSSPSGGGAERSETEGVSRVQAAVVPNIEGSVLADRRRPAADSLLTLQPGRVVGLIGSPGFGLTRLGLHMLAGPEIIGPVAYLDVRGWFCPPAAWEAGIEPDRLVVVRCDDPIRWGRAVTAVLEGVRALYAEVPRGMKDAQLRKLGSLARSRRSALILRPLRGVLPSGLAHLRLTAREVIWSGTDEGHGRLVSRRMVFEASGKAVHGMTRLVEVEDHGADALHLVSGLAVASAGRAAG